MASTRIIARCFLVVTLALAGVARLHADEADELAAMMLSSGGFTARQAAGTMSFDFENIAIEEALEYIATEGDLAITLKGNIDAPVTLKLQDVLPEEALSVLASHVGATIERESDRSYRISPTPEMSVSYTDAPLQLVLNQLARQSGTDIVLSPDVEGNVNLQLKNVSWRQALNVVVKTSGYEVVEEEGGILRVVTTEDLRDQVATQMFELRYVQPPDVYRPLIDTEFAVGGPNQSAAAISYSGAGASAAGQAGASSSSSGPPFTLLNSVVNALSQVGRVEYEPSSNSLIVTDIKPRLEQVAKIIELIDTAPPQVFVDVKFVSTNKNDLTDFGVDWTNGWTWTSQFSAMSHRLPFNLGKGGFEDALGIIGHGPPATEYSNTTGLVTPVGTTMPENGGWVFGRIDFTAMTAVLRLLKRDENTTILQSPRLVTLDNQAGTIFVGQTIRFAETFSASAQGGAVQRGIREAENSPVETGFQLLIIPHVVRGTDEVILTIIPEDSSLVGRAGQNIAGFERFNSGTESIDLPQVASRTMVTRVLVRHGQTLVLGGLINEVDTENERKVPWFGDIPLLGWLFKNRTVSKDKRNLMIFLTVMIENTPDDIEAVYQAHRYHEADRHSAVEYLTRPLEGRRAIQERDESGLPDEGRDAASDAPE